MRIELQSRALKITTTLSLQEILSFKMMNPVDTTYMDTRSGGKIAHSLVIEPFPPFDGFWASCRVELNKRGQAI